MIGYTERCERMGGTEKLGNGACLRVGGLVVLAAVLFGMATPAFGQLSLVTVPPHWKLSVKPDAAGVIAGRLPYEDYIMIDELEVTSFELNRLGFGSFTPTITLGVSGAYNFSVTLKSNLQGRVTITGTMLAASMSGTAQWSKDGKVYNYTFTGVPYTPAVDPES